MEFRQSKAFLAVVDEGGFGRAAQRLHIVQSAVSQQVKRLERELGVTLFDRTGRLVRLSAAGEHLLPEARAVLAAVRRTREVAARVAAGAEGVVRFGTVNGSGERLYLPGDGPAARTGRRVPGARRPVLTTSLVLPATPSPMRRQLIAAFGECPGVAPTRDQFCARSHLTGRVLGRRPFGWGDRASGWCALGPANGGAAAAKVRP